MKSLFVFLFTLYFSASAQLRIGPHISRVNIPAASFKSIGGGITSEFGELYTISLDYFSDKRPVDSVGFLPDGGVIQCIRHTRFNINLFNCLPLY